MAVTWSGRQLSDVGWTHLHISILKVSYIPNCSVYIAYTQNPFPRDLAAVAGVAKADLRGKADAKLDRV